MKAIIAKRDEVVKALDGLRSNNKIYFFTSPNPPQKRLLDAWGDRSKKVFTFTGGNRSGKTTVGVIIALSVMFGEWPWNGERVGDYDLRRARRIRYIGQGWESHIKTVLEPKLKEWWPKDRPCETKKNNQGIEAFWVDKRSGSSLEVLSNNQESDVFEGWEGDLVVYDEPPRRDVRIAASRGLIDRKGRELFCATLLKEAWIHREVIRAKLADGSPDMSVFNVEATTFDNVGFGLTQEGIDQFAKTLTEDEKQARLYGKPSYMSTLVWPQFNRERNVRARFPVPLDWMVDIQIDFHPAKPWNALFVATDRRGFKYVVDEMKERGNPKTIAEWIIRKIKDRNYRVNSIEIDPLAKGNENVIDDTVYGVMGDVFAAYGLCLGTASKDKDNGMVMVRDALYSENEMPTLFFFKDCVGTIQQVEDYMFDPDTDKPSKKDDDFCECLYRAILKNTQWYPVYGGGREATASVML